MYDRVVQGEGDDAADIAATEDEGGVFILEGQGRLVKAGDVGFNTGLDIAGTGVVWLSEDAGERSDGVAALEEVVVDLVRVNEAGKPALVVC